ncbi:hypothetical protein [Vreelandella stevensii]|uniref:hypothetical protein n=1 Tax=Vreelandella stevensii TaxID=502821 RepID=UPI003748AE4E
MRQVIERPKQTLVDCVVQHQAITRQLSFDAARAVVSGGSLAQHAEKLRFRKPFAG